MRLAAAEACIGSYSDDPTGFHARHREVMAGLAAQLCADLGARITDRYDGCRVKLAGITASSTSGIASALRNWIKAAKKMEAVQW